MNKTLLLDGYSLNLEHIREVALENRKVALHPQAYQQLERARACIESRLQSGEAIYGVNTGFGYLKNRRIGIEDIRVLQRNLILSHAAGVGEPFGIPTVRAMILLRANTLVQGHSGVRPVLAETLLQFLNQQVHPVIPCQGSVGASGDLAPLAHLALALIGEGSVWDGPQPVPSLIALRRKNIQPLELQAKEGLALINGTQPMAAVGALVALRMKSLLDLADMVAAMTLQATMGTDAAYRPELHRLRPHRGQQESAANLWAWLQGSEIIASHRDCEAIQDAYSLRCAPQVHGASRDTWHYLCSVLEIEINAVTDNPLVLPESGEILSCGHFHGQPVALAMDFAAIALCEIGSISERRIERLINPQLSNGLPPFLAAESGLNSGYMIAQYIAAALVSENKGLAHPASVDSIPTSANQEDHVSMGTIAARKAYRILEHVERILAIELLCACQGLDFRKPLRPSIATRPLYKYLRRRVPHLRTDRQLSLEIEAVSALIASGQLSRLLPGAEQINKELNLA